MVLLGVTEYSFFLSWQCGGSRVNYYSPLECRWMMYDFSIFFFNTVNVHRLPFPSCAVSPEPLYIHTVSQFFPSPSNMCGEAAYFTTTKKSNSRVLSLLNELVQLNACVIQQKYAKSVIQWSEKRLNNATQLYVCWIPYRHRNFG